MLVMAIVFGKELSHVTRAQDREIARVIRGLCFHDADNRP
jgi:hypothetical protein